MFLCINIFTIGCPSKRLIKIQKDFIRSHYIWPGNVRELLNTLRRVTLFAESEIISERESCIISP